MSFYLFRKKAELLWNKLISKAKQIKEGLKEVTGKRFDEVPMALSVYKELNLSMI